MADWPPSHNRSLVRRGRRDSLFAYDFLGLWRDVEIEEMSERKDGRKYRSWFLIHVVGCIRVCLHLPYRQTEGVIKATGKNLPNPQLFTDKQKDKQP